jgi:molybdopterin/thiamine biosynthesis adenylyltransferase
VKTEGIKSDITHSTNGGPFLPHVFDMSSEQGRSSFTDCLNELENPEILDLFEQQYKELIKSRSPKPLSDTDLESAYYSYIDRENPKNCGTWVYYPWKNTLLHILGESEFVELRTSRNLYKITRQEQSLLTNKKVGIIGLSVGHSAALNFAMERSVGELRLADFDTLETSNLNRIKTNLLNVGLPKVVMAAREIAELDPFIKVRCFEEGITDENLHEFFTAGGDLSLLVEECDSLDIKIKARFKARELGIPVLMETSDRGMIDVERFDLEPQRPILHGMIDHLDTEKVAALESSEEKIPYLMPMVGIDTMSSRLKASAIEVGSTINTWPQLASSVMLGGAIVADTHRRIMLNQFRKSGRYIVDPAQILSEDFASEPTEKENISTLTEDHMKAMLERFELPEQCVFPDLDEIKKIVLASGTAPSGGNSQPWVWMFYKGSLHLFFDKSRSDSFMDYKHSASYMSLGACLENARVRAHSMGYSTEVAMNNSDHSALVCCMTFHEGKGESELSDYIEKRYTDRSLGDKNDKSVLEKTDEFKAICSEFQGINVLFFEDESERQIIGEVVGISDRLRILHPGAHHDLVNNEMRWDESELKERRNGIFVDELMLSPSDFAGLKLIRDHNVTDFLRAEDGGRGLTRISSKLLTSAPLLIYASTNDFSRKSFFEAGVLMEKIWLYATSCGFGVQVLNVPMAFLLRLKQKDLGDFDEKFLQEVESMSKMMNSVIHDYQKLTDMWLMRLFTTEEKASNSVRLELSEILKIA